MPDKVRDILSIIFIGHVDAGKSTICGQIIKSLNLVSQRTLQKLKEDASANNRESWYLSYLLDTNEEERMKGKTVETGRASFLLRLFDPSVNELPSGDLPAVTSAPENLEKCSTVTPQNGCEEDSGEASKKTPPSNFQEQDAAVELNSFISNGDVHNAQLNTVNPNDGPESDDHSPDALGRDPESSNPTNIASDILDQPQTLSTSDDISSYRKVVILDAPGHKNFVKQMITGASQADLAILVLSARINEFESGLKAQTREHVLLCKSMGIQNLLVLVNKMDDESVKYSRTRYDEILKKVSPFLKKVYGDVVFIPVSGYLGCNIAERSPDIEWYNGPAFLEFLEGYDKDIGRYVSKEDRISAHHGKVSENVHVDKNLPQSANDVSPMPIGAPKNPTDLSRQGHDPIDGKIAQDLKNTSQVKNLSDNINEALTNLHLNDPKSEIVFYVTDKLKTLGTTYLYGKLHSGALNSNDPIKVLPLNKKTTITQLITEEDVETNKCLQGDTVKLRLKDFTDDVSPNSVLVNFQNTSHLVCDTFTASLSVLEECCITVGFTAMMHLRGYEVYLEIMELRQAINGKIVRKRVVRKNEVCLAKIKVGSDIVLRESEKGESFAVRDRDKTIALGRVRKIFAKE